MGRSILQYRSYSPDFTKKVIYRSILLKQVVFQQYGNSPT